MATACAPPAACTSVMPSNAHAARIDGCGKPSCSGWGGDATAISLTPATWAGMTFISTEDGYATRPPGTYTPARRTGRYRSVTVDPEATAGQDSAGSWALCTSLARRPASVTAARQSGSSSASAAARALAGTRGAGPCAPAQPGPVVP